MFVYRTGTWKGFFKAIPDMPPRSSKCSRRLAAMSYLKNLNGSTITRVSRDGYLKFSMPNISCSGRSGIIAIGTFGTEWRLEKRKLSLRKNRQTKRLSFFKQYIYRI